MKPPEGRETRLVRRIETEGLVAKADIERAQTHATERGIGLRTALVELGLVASSEILRTLEETYQIPSVSLPHYEIDPRALAAVPAELARHYEVVPLFRIGETVTVALADPLAYWVLEDLEVKTGLKVKPAIAEEAEIGPALERAYGPATEKIGPPPAAPDDREYEERVQTVQTEDETISLADLAAESEDVSVVRTVQSILGRAIECRASDIHLEPCEDRLRVRYRVDGYLQDVGVYPPELRQPVASRVKILARLDIADKRRPHDGRFKMKLGERRCDIRVSTLPTPFGEKVVLRLLDPETHRYGLDDLGFAPDTLARFREICQIPYGIVLVTGPTGSGKTTTLYAVLKEIATPDENVVTLEDPIEYLVDGITQVHVQPKAGLTFEKGLEAIMRQDPDIILVGEIRDAETARIAARAAMTGHLLLSTLHTNDSAEAVQRLDEMGVEPYLLASSLLGILAQRLLRRICPKCEETDPVESPLLPGAQLRRGRGCANCNQTGYRGRDGIYELLPASEEIRRLVAAGADAGRIRWQARQQGMRTLREEAIEKVRQGRTTLSEALSLTRADEDIGPP